MAQSVERNLSPSRVRERDLVLAFQSGDPAAFDSIDKNCRPAAERICRRLLINNADVEEAVQETMVRAYQGLPRFNGSYALTAWVARIATNVCLDAIRARSRRPVNAGAIEPHMEVPNGHESAETRDPEELVEQRVAAEEVREILSELPEKHRTALVLREFEGYSHRQIARMLDTSPQRVKALIHRAKAGFRRAWDHDGPGRIAAFAPLLTPVNWLRKILGRAPEFDHPVVASATSAAQVASTPVFQGVFNVAGERLTTALATVMLAGTVSFAVQHAPKTSQAEEQPVVPIEIVAAPLPVEEEKPVVKEEKPKPEKKPVEAVVVPTPTPDPSPTPEIAGDLPPEEEKNAQDVANADTEDAALPPHPVGFTYSFSSDRAASEPCACPSTPTLTQSDLQVSEEAFSAFSGQLSNAGITDANGQVGWGADIGIRATAQRLDLELRVDTGGGTSSYETGAVLSEASKEAWGGWTYSYTGTYEWRSGSEENADVPRRGSFAATLTFSHAEQRLVSAAFSFTEAA